MIRHASKSAAIVMCAALVACGGGSTSSIVPAPTITPTGAPATTPTARFTILVPAQASHTGSVGITLQGVNGQAKTQATTVAQISSTAPGCTANAQNLSCTVNVPGVAGADLYSISSYASSNGTGTPLATASVVVTVSSSAQAPVSVSLGGVPVAVAFSPNHLPLVNDGAIHRVPIVVNALDASGSTIVGATPYSSALSLRILNDGAHALSLSTTTVSQPGTVVTLTYDGSKPLTNAEIVASGNGVSSATLTAAPLTATPAALQLFDDSTGGASVQLSESGFAGSFTASLANPNDATATVIPGTIGSGSAVVTVLPASGIRFDVTDLTIGDGSASETVPVAIVPHNGSYKAFGNQHQMTAPLQLVRGPDGRLWSGDAPNGTLVAFDPATDAYTTYSVVTDGNGPVSLAFDASGNIWFTDRTQIGEFVPSTSAVTFYSSGLPSSANVTNIIAGPAGSHTMWFYDMGTNIASRGGNPSYFGSIDTTSGTITEYQTSNDVSPVLSGLSMVLGPDNAVWFTDGYNGAIGKINPSNGAITEFSVNTPQYPSQSPAAIVAGPDGKLWFLSDSVSTGAAVYGTVDPASGNVLVYNNGIAGGLFYDAITASDHNIWFSEEQGQGFFLSTQTTIGVINPATHAIYQYPAFIPQFSIITSIIDAGNGALWMLDGGGYGQIGTVTFK